MLKRKIDKGLQGLREGIIMYRDIEAYVTIHIVTHDVLLVVVSSRDFYVRNEATNWPLIFLLVVGTSKFMDKRQQNCWGCDKHNSINPSVCLNENTHTCLMSSV